jgi:type I restriction enzyme R subunit
VQLRSKKALIEEFIDKCLETIPFASDIEDTFYEFWDEKKKEALKKLIAEEGLISNRVQQLIDTYIFTEKKPLREEIVSTLKVKPTILQRKTVVERVSEKLMKFIEVFIEGI